MSRGHNASSADSPLGSGQSLDARVCGAFGARLHATREALKWTHGDVANRLLLSKAQVHGLERADAGAFHNPAFFAVALRKYSTLLGLDCPDGLLTPASANDASRDESRRATSRTSADESRGTATIDSPAPRSSASPMKWLAVAVIAVLVVVTGVRLARYFPVRTPRAVEVTSASAPALPVAALGGPPHEIPPAAPVETADASLPEPLATSAPPAASTVPAAVPTDRPALAPPVPTGDEPAGIVTLAHPAWVFVRYGDNSVIERTLQAGQSLTLTSPPIYLAIGAGEGVTVTLHDHPVDVTPFRNGDEIRIPASDLATLAR